MRYELGAKSFARLKGVRPDMVSVVGLAITYTHQDFSVLSGVRTEPEQRILYNSGASKTMNSRHLIQPSGFGEAVDLVPYVNGQLRWEWPLIYPIARAMNKAANEIGVVLRWGGVWDRDFNDFGWTLGMMRQAVIDYCDRHPGPDFIDGPHYEIQ